MPGPATIVDVAAAAGVAVSTVSRVLNDGSASASTQAKVERAIAELRFVPSSAARNLKRGTTGIVGIAGASTRAPWFIELLEGMETVLSRHAGSIAICSWQEGDAYDAGPIRAWIKDRRIDQLVLVRPSDREQKLLRAASRAQIPTVVVVPDIETQGSLIISADNLAAGREAGDHLRALGHEEICFLGGPKDSVDAHHRLQGLRLRLSEEGLALPDSRVRFASNYDAESGLELARKWLRSSALRACTAAVLGNDALALGFMRELQAENVQLPRDLSVIGFDGVPVGGLVWPGLTSVGQPVTTMGRDLAERLVSGTPFPKDAILYPSRLIERESTRALCQMDSTKRRRPART